MAETILHREPREGDIDHRASVQPALQVDHRYPNATPEARQALRARTIDAFRAAAAARQRLAFEEILPHHHVTELLHPGPAERDGLARTARNIRLIGWRGAEWIASIRALDLTVTRQWRWLVGLSLYHRVNRDIYWNVGEPHRVPAGIPKGRPTDEDRAKWQPEPTFWDVQDAAMHELELGAGGAATLLLRGLWPSDNPNRMAAEATVTRVHKHLDHILKNGVPDDPRDPNEWGHDARLKSLVITDLGANRVVPLMPRFDPEVTAYTANAPIAPPASIDYAPVHPLTPDPVRAYSRGNAVLTITVLAADGVTSRVYTVTVE